MNIYIIGFNLTGEHEIKKFIESKNIPCILQLVINNPKQEFINLDQDKNKNKFIFNTSDPNQWILRRLRQKNHDLNAELYVKYLYSIYQTQYKSVINYFQKKKNLLIFNVDTDCFASIGLFLNINTFDKEKHKRVNLELSNYSVHNINNLILGYTDPRYDLVIVAIIKNESPYLKEWLDVNIKLGVQHFFIYDDESTDNPMNILKSYIKNFKVTYSKIVRRDKNNPSIFLPGQRWIHLIDFFSKYKNISRWVMHIDIDEFFYTTNNKSLIETIDKVSNQNRDGLLVFPYEFGSKTDYKNINIPCITRFKYRGATLKTYVKSIVNPRLVDIDKLNNPHYLFLMNNNYGVCNSKAEIPIQTKVCKIESPGNDLVSYPIFNYLDYQQDFQIIYNHYRYKTYEEWLNKCDKYKYNTWNGFYKDPTFIKSDNINNVILDDRLYKKININK
jgi:hypothetical protein